VEAVCGAERGGMSKGYVISFCDYTTNILKPWAEAGYACFAYDIAHESIRIAEDGIWRVGYDLNIESIADALYENRGDYALACAFPPCTDLAVSGARWFKSKGDERIISAADFAMWCNDLCAVTGAPYFVENPVGLLSTLWRKPDHYFDPCDYAGYGHPEDAYTKKTCLWTGNGFKMPAKKRVDPIHGSKMHLMPPSKDRGAKRSVTPMGFARAVFEANHAR
jgi:hypothetical protein